MPFPDQALDVAVELLLGGEWIDIKAQGHVYTRDPITITRGRGDEASRADPASCTLTINNRDGRYSPRNPMSPYYGLLGRNTPIRVSVAPGPVVLRVPAGETTAGATAPDSAGVSVTGDLDVRIDIDTLWRDHSEGLFGQYDQPTNQRSWTLWVTNAGTLTLYWSTDGGNLFSATSTEAVAAHGRQVVRATLDVNNGAGGHTARFYVGDSLNGPWTQLGAPVTAAGTTSIFNGAATLAIPDTLDASSPSAVYAAQVRNGIDGPIVASPDFTAQARATTSFVDAQGNTWTVTGTAEITDRIVRFYGEVPSWPVKWLPGGHDVWVPIEAAGITRRLGQGAKPLQSALSRSIAGMNPPFSGWWPLEDAPGSTSAAAGYAGMPAARVSGPVTFTGEPHEGIGGGAQVALGGEILATVQSPPLWTVACWVDVPAELGETDFVPILQWTTPASPGVTQWNLYTVGAYDGIIQLEAFAADGSGALFEVGVTDLRGLGPVQVRAEASQQDGTGFLFVLRVNHELEYGINIDGDVATPVTSVAVSSRRLSGVTSVGTVSQLLVSGYRPGHYFDLMGAAAGHVGETAGARILRLCGEEAVPATVDGDAVGTETMGPQGQRTFLELLGECEAADGGTLHEQLDALGLTYRTRAADYNTPPALTLDYHDQVAAPLEPVDDDQATRNDITIERDGGSSARVVVESGPLSVQPPPDGVGIYNESLTLNVEADAQLLPIASWRAHLGTVDEARFPVVRVKLHKHPELITAVTGADLRSRLHLTDLPPWAAPGLVDLLIDGYTEIIEPLRWTLEYNTVPGTPYRVASLDDKVLGRLDTDGSQLAAAVDADDTTLSVATTAGPLWTTNVAEFPFDVVLGGEVVTVTSITGAASPQTFTVTRAANGVVKAHTAGTQVRLAQPMILAL